MRRSLLLLLLIVTPAAAAAEVEFVHVWPRYREATSFLGIREYFGGEEPDRGRTIRRSQPDERSGYYWLVRTRSDRDLPEATFEVSLLRPGETEPELRRFPVPLPTGSHPVLLGLTGADWPAANVRPLAWRVRLIGPGGEQLAVARSFLWEHPGAQD